MISMNEIVSPRTIERSQIRRPAKTKKRATKLALRDHSIIPKDNPVALVTVKYLQLDRRNSFPYGVGSLPSTQGPANFM